MTPKPSGALSTGLASTLALHSLSWLAIASGVGLLLVLLLAWPEGNRLLAPWTYGRWAPIHLELMLYGWTALPLVGILFKQFLPGEEGGTSGRLALVAWSGALGAGAGSLLAGGATGKLFLEFRGPVRLLWLGALSLLWLLLARGLWRAFRNSSANRTSGKRALAVRGALLAGLGAVPWAMNLAMDTRTYPPIDPSTGGPTGTDLLASTLALVPLLLVLPAALDLPSTPKSPAAAPLWGLWLAHLASLPLFGFGDRSHTTAWQIAAVASVIVWPLPLARHLLARTWPQGSSRWLWTAGTWGGLLALSALWTFLPGHLDAVKFTHLLVGHAHLAMAGFTTAVSALLLHALIATSPLAPTLAAPRPFWLWQGGTAVQVAALSAIGGFEAADSGALWRPDSRISLLFAFRACGGAAMFLAACLWLREAMRRSTP